MSEIIQPTLSLSGASLPVFDDLIRAPAGPSPHRRAQSVRRTMSLDAVWPEGRDGPVEVLGACRDIATHDPAEPPVVIEDIRIDVLTRARAIEALTATPPVPGLDALVGARAGGHLRSRIAETLPDAKARGGPLYLLLDDLAGTTLVCQWAWSVWRDHAGPRPGGPARDMEGVCIGFRPGSSALARLVDHEPAHNASRVKPLVNPADPEGWHELPAPTGPHFRRARRIDVWREGDRLHVDAGFQDSASAPDGGDRFAVHEYRLFATAGADGVLRTLEAVPGTLPYRECRAAPVNLDHLVGRPLADLRDEVLALLRKTAGCTHLNDMLRALADVPALVRSLG